MSEQAQDVYVFANNHWQGQSIAAVRQLKMMMDIAPFLWRAIRMACREPTKPVKRSAVGGGSKAG
jgi:hypothetical protein